MTPDSVMPSLPKSFHVTHSTNIPLRVERLGGVSSDRPCSKKGPCVLSGPNVVAENRCRRIARSSVEARRAQNSQLW